MRVWLMWCMKRSSFSILVNGSPVEPFHLQKGFGQGDPIFSFLFTKIAKSLSYVIKTSQSKGLVRGVEVGKDRVELYHLQITDDTLIFLSEDDGIATNYK